MADVCTFTHINLDYSFDTSMLTTCLASLVLCSANVSFKFAPKPTFQPLPSRRQLNSTYRWSLLVTYLQIPSNVPTAISAIDKAAAAGYNGVILQDWGLTASYPLSSAYKTALATVLAEAKNKGIEVIPAILPSGSGPEILTLNPSLVESMPVQNVHYTVHNRKLELSESPISVVNASFESFNNGAPTGFTGASNSDATIGQDTATYHSGTSSLRIDGHTPTLTTGGAWYNQTVAVSPWHQYRLTLWSMSSGASGSNMYLNALSPSGQQLSFMQKWTNTSGWVQNEVVFNSQANSSITISIGAQPSAGASIWVDDLAITDVGLLNVTRRTDCPLVIKGTNGTTYQEGKDVNTISDPNIAAHPGSFDTTHTPPTPTVPNGSGLVHGNQVALSFEAAAVLGGTGVCACFSEPGTQALITEEIQEIIPLFNPKHVLLDTDETRIIGWDPACSSRNLTGGEIFGNLVQQEAALVHKVSPSIQIVMYSDMFDPNANSQANYYLVNGGTLGTASFLPSNSLILNWGFKQPQASLDYFSQLGFSQVLFGYYDNTGVAPPIGLWAQMAESVARVEGFVYVSYLQDFSNLATFSQQAIAANPSH